MEVKTPALENALIGSLYIGEPLPGNQYRAFMIFDGEGIHAKLAADFVPDPVTGRVTMSVQDIPQVPFEEFDLHLFASDRGLVATPTHCGIYSGTADMIPWNQTQAPQHVLAQRLGQERPQRPARARGPCGHSSRASWQAPRAPSRVTSRSFILRLDRDDGDQFLGDLNFRMPPGFTGDLRGISYCPEAAILAAAQNSGRAEQATPSCPASSQIGTTNVAAGPGEHPFHAVGKMYLSGPFKGAPLSLVAVTPALAGPYDYGVVVVRVALHIDPLTAQVSAASDTVPSIIGGVPIRMRSIQVNIDKEHFTINPTNCSPFTVDSQGIGDQGTVTDFSSYFQVVNCDRLPFKPKMTVRQLGGRKSTRSAAEPGAPVRPDHPPRRREHQVALGDALERLRDRPEAPGQPLHRERTRGDRSAPGASRSARRRRRRRCSTSRSRARSTRSRAPAACRGWPSSSTARSTCSRRADAKTVKGGRLQTTVPVVPDAPIGHFHLIVFGGKHGYLANTRDLCKHTPLDQHRLHRPERQDQRRIGEGQEPLRRVERPPQAPPALRVRPGLRGPAARYVRVRKPPLGLGKCGGDRSG